MKFRWGNTAEGGPYQRTGYTRSRITKRWRDWAKGRVCRSPNRGLTTAISGISGEERLRSYRDTEACIKGKDTADLATLETELSDTMPNFPP
ncbi:hypothetical protein KM043_015539 [Ampulex compressa]|nr:hypothetical protein KM043_015539 [Ampulex compressa]